MRLRYLAKNRKKMGNMFFIIFPMGLSSVFTIYIWYLPFTHIVKCLTKAT